MDNTTLLIIILIVVILLGGGWYGRGRWFRLEHALSEEVEKPVTAAKYGNETTTICAIGRASSGVNRPTLSWSRRQF
jgi:hypothetical protein